MKIRSKLTLRFTIVVASILILFSLAVYYFSSLYRTQSFYSRLTEKANNTAKLLVDVDEVNANLLKIIDRNTSYLPDERIVVYNYLNKEIYDNVDRPDPFKVADNILNEVRLKGEIKYKEGDKEFLGILYTGKYDRFIVMASALDVYGLKKLNNLRTVLIISLFICVLLTTISGWFFSGKALDPISEIVKQVDNITSSNLKQRINEGNGTDEIAQLAINFNKMLDRIEKAFELQQSFVSNASHELRTPLTSITGQIEVALMNARTKEEYETILHSVLEDIKGLNKLTNGLLELAQTDIDISNIKFSKIRIDELLWQVKDDFKKTNPNYTINIQIEGFSEDEEKLSAQGNELLLKTAISNIIENGCKFSANKEVNVSFNIGRNSIKLICTDNGIGISKKDIEKLFHSFYRASNAGTFPGHGLGLLLTKKIIDLHKGQLLIDSELNSYTAVKITLPSIG